MRDRLLYLAILAAAAAVAAILVFRAHLAPPAPEPAEPLEAALAPPAPAPALASARPEPPDAGPARPPPYVHVDPASAAACGEGMVLVDGVYCPFVGHTCVSFADEAHDVCDRYSPEVLCEGRLEHRRYCVDVF